MDAVPRKCNSIGGGPDSSFAPTARAQRATAMIANFKASCTCTIDLGLADPDFGYLTQPWHRT